MNIEEIREIESAQGIDKALDRLYDEMDGLLKAGKLDEISASFSILDVGRYSDDLLIGLLTAALPARSKITAYSDLCRKVESEIRSRGTWEPDLLKGLHEAPR